jgi:hypothetical protein
VGLGFSLLSSSLRLCGIFSSLPFLFYLFKLDGQLPDRAIALIHFIQNLRLPYCWRVCMLDSWSAMHTGTPAAVCVAHTCFLVWEAKLLANRI